MIDEGLLGTSVVLFETNSKVQFLTSLTSGRSTQKGLPTLHGSSTYPGRREGMGPVISFRLDNKNSSTSFVINFNTEVSIIY